MSTNRQSFKGESLAGGTMDTMHGKLLDTTPRVKKAQPAPVAEEAAVETTVEPKVAE